MTSLQSQLAASIFCFCQWRLRASTVVRHMGRPRDSYCGLAERRIFETTLGYLMYAASLFLIVNAGHGQPEKLIIFQVDRRPLKAGGDVRISPKMPVVNATTDAGFSLKALPIGGR